MKRGQLTKQIQSIAKAFLGREIDTTELRLYAYMDYVMKNEQRIKPAVCNQDDRDILKKLREEGHIEGGAGGLGLTKEFYDYMQEVLWWGYVAYESQPLETARKGLDKPQ